MGPCPLPQTLKSNRKIKGGAGGPAFLYSLIGGWGGEFEGRVGEHLQKSPPALPSIPEPSRLPAVLADEADEAAAAVVFVIQSILGLAD